MIDVKRRIMDYDDYQTLLNGVRLKTPPPQYASFATVKSWQTKPCCPTCGFPVDAQPGFLRSEFPISHVYFGFLVRCPECSDALLMETRLRQRANLQGWLSNATFDEFRITPEQRELIQACKHLALLPKHWICLWGAFGTGKTHLLAATVNMAIANKHPAAYYTLPDLLGAARNQVADGDIETFIHDLECLHILALDELDPNKAQLTDWGREFLFRILDARYRTQRGTILALQAYPDPAADTPLGYLYSRIWDANNRVFELNTGDVRPVKNGNKA